jgi:NDP-sugar pyrophosphorylase family protein
VADLCAVLLAAGEGRRLRPLTSILPKPLCPVGNVTLFDRALADMFDLGFHGADEIAANAWHLADAIVQAAAGRTHVNVETTPEPLGSAGGLAALRDWIDGRDVVVANADAYLSGGTIDGLLDGWTGQEVRMLVVPAGAHPREFGTDRFAGISAIPWHYLEKLEPEPTDLVRTVWRPAEAAGDLRTIRYTGVYLDCGTPADYLAANLHATGGHNIVADDAQIAGAVHGSVVGAGARVHGEITRTVVWPGAIVAAGERLSDAIRYGTTAAATLI